MSVLVSLLKRLRKRGRDGDGEGSEIEDPSAPESRDAVKSSVRVMVTLALYSIHVCIGAAVVRHLELRGDAGDDPKRQRDWTFGSACYYFVVTSTTIGYGDVVPETGGGRAWVAVWGLFGLALVGYLVSLVGQVVMDIAEAQRKLFMKHVVGNLNQLGGSLADAAKRAVGRRRGGSQPPIDVITATDDVERFSDGDDGDNNNNGHVARHGGATTDNNGATDNGGTEANNSISNNDIDGNGNREGERVVRKMRVKVQKSFWKEHSALLTATTMWLLFFVAGAFLFRAASPSDDRWEFSEAMWFCWATMTTVGYGDYAPESSLAKVLMPVFALLTLGIVGIVVGELGESIAKRAEKLVAGGKARVVAEEDIISFVAKADALARRPMRLEHRVKFRNALMRALDQDTDSESDYTDVTVDSARGEGGAPGAPGAPATLPPLVPPAARRLQVNG